MKNYLVTGGAGFIGSHLIDALLADVQTERVVVIDNFSSGCREHLGQHEDDLRLEIARLDLVNPIYDKHFDGVECVFHLASNPDARRGIENTRLDLELETIATYNVLEAMRRAGAKKIIFSSSGTVYGDSGFTVCKEGVGERLPISLYGAGKVASEALISAFCGTFGFSSVIFRFGNVVGERATHGCIFDFIKQLKEHPDHLDVLGNGGQSKPYLYVKEVVAGLLHGIKILNDAPDTWVAPYNLAPFGATNVRFIVEELISEIYATGKIPKIHKCKVNYGSDLAGWAGDVPHSRMNMAKLNEAGFSLERSSDEAVKHAIRQIVKTI